jgi:hypothetical protein
MFANAGGYNNKVSGGKHASPEPMLNNRQAEERISYA